MFSTGKSYDFNFRGTIVLVNGIAQDTLGLCYLLGVIDYASAMAFIKSKPTYRQLANELLAQLVVHDYRNISIH